MIEVRRRRSSEEQSADILRLKLARLMRVTAKRKAAYESAQEAEAKVQQVITLLDQLPLPGMEPEPAQDVPQDDGTATIAPAAEAARRAVRVEGKCPHGFLAGWCSKPECQTEGEVT